ncbi:DUF2278 family protein, partial [Mycobacterium tuberculosis]|nr:DUF2278 family protein [Mycobacterium tuberculosis]
PGLALDYGRGALVTQQDMEVAPFDIAHPRNGLRNALLPMLEKGIATGQLDVYAFGQSWEDEAAPDQFFGFTPGNGIHNIHM